MLPGCLVRISVLFPLLFLLLSPAGLMRAAEREDGTNRKDRPSIILAMADDQGWGDMAYNGHPALRTPVFDEMSRTGLRFDRFYAAAPVCSPTRGSVLTGRTPNRFGCFSWGYSLRPEENTVAEILQSAGYATGHFGKWHLGSIRADSPVSPGQSGFEEWLSSPNFFEIDPWMSRRGTAVPTKGEGSEVIVDAALDFIRHCAGKQQPFLTVIWFGSPHAPHSGQPDDLALYADQPRKQQAFLAEITAMDRAMGKLRKGLKEAGVADNTVLWYCSDNGAIDVGSTGGLRGKKGSLHEGGLRVPGLLEWPARIKAPRVIDLPAGTVDLFPTVLELAGAKAPDQRPLDGVSLVPMLEGRAMPSRTPLGFWDAGQKGQPVRSSSLLEELAAEQKSGTVAPASERAPAQTGKLDAPWPTDRFPGHSAWLDGSWKLHRIEGPAGKVQWELYDLARDRVESVNRLEEEPARTARMQQELNRWLQSVVESLHGHDYTSHGHE